MAIIAESPELEEAERQLLQNVPSGAMTVSPEPMLPGARTRILPSGCRITVQHDIQHDDDVVRLDLDYVVTESNAQTR